MLALYSSLSCADLSQSDCAYSGHAPNRRPRENSGARSPLWNALWRSTCLFLPGTRGCSVPHLCCSHDDTHVLVVQSKNSDIKAGSVSDVRHSYSTRGWGGAETRLGLHDQQLDHTGGRLHDSCYVVASDGL